MERSVIDSADLRLGLCLLVVGVRGRVAVEATSRLVTVEHQYGGYSCLQETLTGVVVPLSEAHARKDLRPLLGGIGSISEADAPADWPVDRRLSALGFTFGEPLPPEVVSDVFSDYLPLPPFTEAWEALAVRTPVRPDVLRGWPVWTETGLVDFDEELQDHLVAAAALSGQPLGLFLLWYNSD